MARYITELDKFEWHDIKATTTDDGRVYHTSYGGAPSVTTILSTLPHPELDEWRERVGHEEADRVSKEACDIGTLMHDSLEAHILKNTYDWGDDEFLYSMAKPMAQVIKLYGFKKLNRVWGVECPLHYQDLYAGRVDLIGVYDGNPTVMDYKTTKFAKSPDYLHNYRIQIALYCMAFEWMHGIRIEHGINFFATRPNIEFGKSAESIIVEIDPKMMMEYKYRAIEVLVDYWSVRNEEKITIIEELVGMIEKPVIN